MKSIYSLIESVLCSPWPSHNRVLRHCMLDSIYQKQALAPRCCCSITLLNASCCTQWTGDLSISSEWHGRSKRRSWRIPPRNSVNYTCPLDRSTFTVDINQWAAKDASRCVTTTNEFSCSLQYIFIQTQQNADVWHLGSFFFWACLDLHAWVLRTHKPLEISQTNST